VEGTFKVGEIAEAIIESDVHSLFPTCGEPDGSVAEPRPSQVLMGSDAGKVPECPKEMIHAQFLLYVSAWAMWGGARL